jgi:hypothetical protein
VSAIDPAAVAILVYTSGRRAAQGRDDHARQPRGLGDGAALGPDVGGRRGDPLVPPALPHPRAPPLDRARPPRRRDGELRRRGRVARAGPARRAAAPLRRGPARLGEDPRHDRHPDARRVVAQAEELRLLGRAGAEDRPQGARADPPLAPRPAHLRVGWVLLYRPLRHPLRARARQARRERRGAHRPVGPRVLLGDRRADLRGVRE